MINFAVSLGTIIICIILWFGLQIKKEKYYIAKSSKEGRK